MSNQKLIEIKDLKKYFIKNKGFITKKYETVKAVENVSFYINKGETLGLVGESGCGKSTTGRTIIKLYEPTEGQMIYDGVDIAHFSKAEMMPYRKKMQMIFQDPYASLNSRMTVADIIGEPLDIHNLASGKERQEKIYNLLDGGQRQRIGIARALAVDPEFIICDEPISALDVSIQAQVVNMLEDLQEKHGLTYLFIAHDLSMVKHISDRVGVMYLGSLMELADSDELYAHPVHPDTQALLSSIPIPDPDINESTTPIILEGDVPSPVNPPSGCKFRTRCRFVKDICSQECPKWKEVSPGHFAACHLL